MPRLRMANRLPRCDWRKILGVPDLEWHRKDLQARSRIALRKYVRLHSALAAMASARCSLGSALSDSGTRKLGQPELSACPVLLLGRELGASIQSGSKRQAESEAATAEHSLGHASSKYFQPISTGPPATRDPNSRSGKAILKATWPTRLCSHLRRSKAVPWPRHSRARAE